MPEGAKISSALPWGGSLARLEESAELAEQAGYLLAKQAGMVGDAMRGAAKLPIEGLRHAGRAAWNTSRATKLKAGLIGGSALLAGGAIGLGSMGSGAMHRLGNATSVQEGEHVAHVKEAAPAIQPPAQQNMPMSPQYLTQPTGQPPAQQPSPGTQAQKGQEASIASATNSTAAVQTPQEAGKGSLGKMRGALPWVGDKEASALTKQARISPAGAVQMVSKIKPSVATAVRPLAGARPSIPQVARPPKADIATSPIFNQPVRAQSPLLQPAPKPPVPLPAPQSAGAVAPPPRTRATATTPAATAQTPAPAQQAASAKPGLIQRARDAITNTKTPQQAALPQVQAPAAKQQPLPSFANEAGQAAAGGQVTPPAPGTPAATAAQGGVLGKAKSALPWIAGAAGLTAAGVGIGGAMLANRGAKEMNREGQFNTSYQGYGAPIAGSASPMGYVSGPAA